jgi:hypothetical protein
MTGKVAAETVCRVVEGKGEGGVYGLHSVLTMEDVGQMLVEAGARRGRG